MNTNEKNLNDIRKAVAEIASRTGETLLETVTGLQAVAAKQKKELILDVLCQYKWELIEELGLLE